MEEGVDLTNVESNMPYYELLHSKIKGLLKRTLAVKLVRETQCNIGGVVAGLTRILETRYGKNTCFDPDLQEMITAVIKILVTFKPWEPASSASIIDDVKIPWETKLEIYSSIPFSETKISALDNHSIHKICTKVEGLEDTIIESFPSLEVFELIEEALEGLSSQERSTKIRALESLITGLLLNIIDKLDLSFEKLITATIVSTAQILENLEFINQRRNHIIHGACYASGCSLEEFIAHYVICVKYFIQEIKCYPLSTPREILPEYSEIEASSDDIQLIMNAYSSAMKAIGSGRHDGSLTERGMQEINLLAKEQHKLWKQCNLQLSTLLADRFAAIWDKEMVEEPDRGDDDEDNGSPSSHNVNNGGMSWETSDVKHS